MHATSPLSLVEQVQTPLLLLLGEKDKRVPLPQSLEYAAILTARGVPCRVLKYPTLGHGLSEEVLPQADVWINVLNWFLERI
jgi:acylaminoacyl-peptidase